MRQCQDNNRILKFFLKREILILEFIEWCLPIVLIIIGIFEPILMLLILILGLYLFISKIIETVQAVMYHKYLLRYYDELEKELEQDK